MRSARFVPTKMARLSDENAKRKSYWLKKRIQTLGQYAQQEGYTTAGFFFRYIWHKAVYGCTFDQFMSLRLFDYSRAGKKNFLSSRLSVRLEKKILDPDVSREDISLFWDKHRFNQAFQPFIRRDWLYAPDSSPEALRAFIDRHPQFVKKLATGTQGEGVTFLRREQLDDIDRFIAGCRRDQVLLEDCIVQHPDMAALNPSSVNTVRIITARYHGKVLPLGAGLRVGGAGAHLDNFHAGGCAYPLDIKTGIIHGPGSDLEGHPYLRHPSTGRIMPGFQVPHWDELLDTVCRAALVSPRIGWVGWDVAILPDGVELVEGNDAPGLNIVQLGGRGFRRELLAFLRSA